MFREGLRDRPFKPSHNSDRLWLFHNTNDQVPVPRTVSWHHLNYWYEYSPSPCPNQWGMWSGAAHPARIPLCVPATAYGSCDPSTATVLWGHPLCWACSRFNHTVQPLTWLHSYLLLHWHRQLSYSADGYPHALAQLETWFPASEWTERCSRRWYKCLITQL